jgi:hypothetical protein
MLGGGGHIGDVFQALLENVLAEVVGGDFVPNASEKAIFGVQRCFRASIRLLTAICLPPRSMFLLMFVVLAHD